METCTSCLIIHQNVYVAPYFTPAKANYGWHNVLLLCIDFKWCRNWNKLVLTDLSLEARLDVVLLPGQ